jgi:uncharacterized membrane protein
LVAEMGRWWAHLWAGANDYQRLFSAADLREIADAIRRGERSHRGEVVFAVESHLHPLAVWRGLTPAARAIDVFSQLRVWDTEENTGVLIYALTVERDIEIVVDRGLRTILNSEKLDALLAPALVAIRSGQAAAGVTQLISALHQTLNDAFPADGQPPHNELSDQAVIL